jgi:CheY-like chemotaxis protein
VRALVVDDDHDTREMLELLLQSIGWEVVAAGSADEAVACFDPDRIDVVLTDIGMPETDGYELLDLLRKRSSHRIPAIAVTGYDSDEARERAERSGFDGHLVKPFRLATLVEIVERVRQQ